MSENFRPYIFKYLFNSLELSTNSKKEKKGSDFDKEVSKNSLITEKQVCEWRELYNRIKHMDNLNWKVSNISMDEIEYHQ
jgi:hypothetical protein